MIPGHPTSGTSMRYLLLTFQKSSTDYNINLSFSKVSSFGFCHLLCVFILGFISRLLTVSVLHCHLSSPTPIKSGIPHSFVLPPTFFCYLTGSALYSYTLRNAMESLPSDTRMISHQSWENPVYFALKQYSGL